tara:strand:- start:953 stop:1174 length:222 start_codon:yes stop_codon:yes gene_type:complete
MVRYNSFMRISINKELISLPDNITVSKMLEKLEIEKKFIAVEINLNIIPKSEYDSHIVRENDSVEIIQAVGGG